MGWWDILKARAVPLLHDSGRVCPEMGVVYRVDAAGWDYRGGCSGSSLQEQIP